MNLGTLRRQLIDFNAPSDRVCVDNFHPLYSMFPGSDTEFNFQTNLTDQPLNWIYRNKSVQYTLNGQYYRCKPFDQINWNNSIVIFGCSNVFGVGVDDADTISSRLREITGLDVINLGVGGSCQQVSLYNMILLKNNSITPRAIIHIWTDSIRPFSVDKNYNIQHNNPRNNFGFPKDAPAAILNEMFSESKSHVVSAMFNRMIANLLYADIHVIHATHFKKMYTEQQKQYPYMPMMLLPSTDVARDLVHPGIESNKFAANLLYQELIKNGTTGETRTLNPEGGRF